MASKGQKSEKTKAQIYEAAIKLFSKHGFDQTSMRLIAKEAGVAAGGIYYYFPSKEALVFEYYQQSHYDHLEQVGNYLNEETDFEKRLMKVVRDKITIAEPHKEMARALYRVAADPKSPLSPFSGESTETREESLTLFKEVVAGSSSKFHKDVKDLLPGYLWLYHMGIILFWIYDTSKGSEKTFQLIDQTVPLIANLNNMLMNPMAGLIRKPILKVLREFQLNPIKPLNQEV